LTLPNLQDESTQIGLLMPRCPLCQSALVTITFGLYPIATCTSCGARWIQDGHQQRAANQIQEPSLMAEVAPTRRPTPTGNPRQPAVLRGTERRNRSHDAS
jgi:hypothetical protein